LQIAERAVKSSIYLTFSSIILIFVGFFGNLILARLLIPEYFGIVALATSIFGFVQRPRAFGLNLALIHKQVDESNRDAYYSTHLIIQALLSLFVIVIAFAISPLLSFKYDKTLIIVFLILATASIFDKDGLSSTPATILEKELRYSVISWANLISTIFSFGIAILLAYLGFGVWSLVVLNLVLIIVPLFIYWLFTPWKPNLKKIRFDRGVALWFLRKQGIFLWIACISYFITLLFDDFLVGTLVGTLALGYYSVAYNISRMPLGLLSNIIQVASPVYSKLQNDMDSLSKNYDLITGFILRLGFLISLVIWFCAYEAIYLFLGEKWIPAIPLVQLLIFYSLGRPLNDALGSVIIAIGKAKDYSKVNLIQGILMIILCPVAVYFLKAEGAAIVVGFLMVLGVLLLQYRINRYFRVNLASIYLSPIITLFVTYFTMLAITRFFPSGMNMWVSLILKILIISSIFMLMIFVLERKKLLINIKYFLSLLKRT
jgi:O-antigen/teichoic acid export membrane protein